MKLGIALDGLLTDTDSMRLKWAVRLGEDFLPDETFWAALQPYSDVGKGLQLAVKDHDVYVLAERPKAFSLVTRMWLKKHSGILFDKDHLVMQALKRYDCRLLGIDAFIDSNPDVLENLKVETVHPIAPYHVDRKQGESLLRVIEEINANNLHADRSERPPLQ